jgi:hypothetical protein
MFKKEDEKFDEIAADPIRRRSAIADRSWRRTLIGSCAWVTSIAALVGILTGGRGAIAGVFCATILWGIFTKEQSDLRLLRVIERLQKSGDEKPTP